ncbi:NAD-dependent epimerase/dehydratase family protein [Amycolatopsis sp. A133]|uniref:NAD-dependent epimerase/dehydratase family protein n=1 Tax=Amycolatopsis sp. A133 TaxID=3064472 RepID=UPI0027ED02EB|nr:NAD-dependent epimerase/dehydratase family protein [Amycolatopsis sp. A133]MDQ7803487.1 NAD-dependent epimerase/dehydratase family protein [Amycolatopsis sp. A133]
MRILLTGGAGFIGSRVAGKLVEDGHEVRVVDALVHGAPPVFPEEVEFVHGDLRDPDTVDRVLGGVELVSHHAAMVGRGKEILDGPRYVGCNDLGTANLLAAMTRRDIGQLVLASSVVIYGDSRYDCPEHARVRPSRRTRADMDAGRYEPRCPECGAELVASAVREDDPLDPPRNVYAVTKLAQEYLVGAWANETGAAAVALRYHNVYGPGIPYDSPYSGVAATFRSAVRAGRAPRVFEDGGPTRDFVHVSDVVSANLAALRWTGAGMRAFNVASGEPRTIGQLATALTEAAGTPAPVVTGEYRPGDVRHIVASADRLRAELSWRPEIGFHAGMREFATTEMRYAS